MIHQQNRINFVDKYNKAGITDYRHNNGKKHVSIDLSLDTNTQRNHNSLIHKQVNQKQHNQWSLIQHQMTLTVIS